jgi:hypothetical protein
VTLKDSGIRAQRGERGGRAARAILFAAIPGEEQYNERVPGMGLSSQGAGELAAGGWRRAGSGGQAAEGGRRRAGGGGRAADEGARSQLMR